MPVLTLLMQLFQLLRWLFGLLAGFLAYGRHWQMPERYPVCAMRYLRRHGYFALTVLPGLFTCSVQKGLHRYAVLCRCTAMGQNELFSLLAVDLPPDCDRLLVVSGLPLLPHDGAMLKEKHGKHLLVSTSQFTIVHILTPNLLFTLACGCVWMLHWLDLLHDVKTVDYTTYVGIVLVSLISPLLIRLVLLALWHWVLLQLRLQSTPPAAGGS